jgi:hypothetical protein
LVVTKLEVLGGNTWKGRAAPAMTGPLQRYSNVNVIGTGGRYRIEWLLGADIERWVEISKVRILLMVEIERFISFFIFWRNGC